MPTPIALALDTPLAVGSMASGAQAYFAIDVTVVGKDLLVHLSDPSNGGDADLFVKYGAAPADDNDYDAASFNTGIEEAVLIRGTVVGTYYVMIDAYADTTGLTIDASVLDASNETALDVVSFTQYGDARSTYNSGGALACVPVDSGADPAPSIDTPFAAYATVIDLAAGRGIALRCSFIPPVYSGRTNTLRLLLTRDEAFVPGYTEVDRAYPFSNVDCSIDIAITNSQSPSAGFPGSGILGVAQAYDPVNQSNALMNFNWTSSKFQGERTLALAFFLIPLAVAAVGDGTYRHECLFYYDFDGTRNFSTVDFVLDSNAPLKLGAFALSPTRTYNPLNQSVFSDPLATQDPAAYLLSASLGLIAGNTPVTPPDGDEAFWTDLVGCMEIFG